MPDISIIFGLILFAFTGAPVDDNAACMVQDENACLSTAQCDVFERGGIATCEIACDERQSQDACTANTDCAWNGGECSYAQSTIPEC